MTFGIKLFKGVSQHDDIMVAWAETKLEVKRINDNMTLKIIQIYDKMEVTHNHQ